MLRQKKEIEQILYKYPAFQPRIWALEARMMEIRNEVKLERFRKRIEYLKAWKEVVDLSMDIMLDDDERAVIENCYFRRLSVRAGCRLFGISLPVYYGIKRRALETLGWCFGMVDEDELDELMVEALEDVRIIGMKLV